MNNETITASQHKDGNARHDWSRSLFDDTFEELCQAEPVEGEAGSDDSCGTSALAYLLVGMIIGTIAGVFAVLTEVSFFGVLLVYSLAGALGLIAVSVLHSK